MEVYENITKGDGIVVYMHMTINSWPSSWKIIFAQGNIKNANTTRANFRIKNKNIAQIFSSNGYRIFKNSFDINRYVNLGTEFEVIFILNRDKHLALFIDGKLVSYTSSKSSLFDSLSYDTSLHYVNDKDLNIDKYADYDIKNIVVSNLGALELSQSSLSFNKLGSSVLKTIENSNHIEDNGKNTKIKLMYQLSNEDIIDLNRIQSN